MTRVTTLLNAAGESHPGMLRSVNEDRFHVDSERGIFFVIDGVGGHAAGEKAADTAAAMMKTRLERQTGTLENRIREAITIANNEIHRQASRTPAWRGMACVLTVAVVDNGHVVVGHVGDTRLYKLRHGRMDKVTRDHSPVGEREDAQELSELEAMRHPRRNEVYRDVGSEEHEAADSDFIDLSRVNFEPDAALLLCSDGLTDCLTAGTINAIVERGAGDPEHIVRALIDAANSAGGKDNVTVVYVEGARFVAGEDTRDVAGRLTLQKEPVADAVVTAQSSSDVGATSSSAAETRRSRWPRLLTVILLLTVSAGALYWVRDRWWLQATTLVQSYLRPSLPRTIVVNAGGSIAGALLRAQPGDQIVVEPGEYRERLQLKSGVIVRSRLPRRASIRLPGGAAESDAAVVALDVTGAEFHGFSIVGDSATPLGTGLLLRNADVAVSDIEITGAKNAAIEFGGGPGSILAADIHDNPGAGLIVRGGAAPRIAHSQFQRNATSTQAPGAIFVEPGSRPTFVSNVFHGVRPETLALPTGADVVSLQRDNTFPDQPARSGRQGGR